MATISENLQTIINIKADIKTAIENKGVTVGDAGFGEYASKINSIEAGGSGSISVDVGTLGIKFGNSTFTEVPDVFDFSNLKYNTCYNLFKECENLVSTPMFDTSVTTNADNMFRGCTSLTSIPLYDFSNVSSLQYTFYECTSLTSIPMFDTSNVSLTSYAFFGCTSLQTIPQFDLSKLSDAQSMFSGCTSLTSIPLINTSGTTLKSTYRMFNGCTNLTSVSNFNTTSVTNMSYMFNGCTSLTTIPAFPTGAVTNMNSMFNGCTNLTTIPTLDCSSVNNSSNAFNNCSSLIQLGGFTNLGAAFTSTSSAGNRTLNFSAATNLTVESVLNVFNSIADISALNASSIIYLPTSVYNSLTSDEISIATTKGWTIKRI